MRKTIVLLCSLLVTALFLTSAINLAKAYIEPFTWMPPYEFRGYDYTFHDGERVVGYQDGTMVELRIPVENDWYSPYMNLTSISLVFDTGKNITLSYMPNPIKLDYDDIHEFVLSFTADADELSYIYTHSYDIRVNYNYPSTSYWQISYSYYYPYYRFVVYTQDQSELMALEMSYNALAEYWTYFNGPEARWLAKQADIEGDLANSYVEKWDFATANTHYTNAIDLYEQAYEADKTWTTKLSDAELNVTKIEADAALKEADAAMIIANAVMNQSYSYILFSIGFIIVGVGILVYAMKKPKVP